MALVKEAVEPDATQEKAAAGMCTAWDVQALAIIAEIEASK